MIFQQIDALLMTSNILYVAIHLHFPHFATVDMLAHLPVSRGFSASYMNILLAGITKQYPIVQDNNSQVASERHSKCYGIYMIWQEDGIHGLLTAMDTTQ